MSDYDWFQVEQLHFAAAEGDVEKCKRLIAEGYNPNEFDQLGHTPLHYAAKGEHFPVIDLLLEHGADVNVQCEQKISNTPLAYVAQTCSLRMAQRLLDAGADPTLSIGLSRSAISRASERKRGEGPRVYELLKRFTEHKST